MAVFDNPRVMRDLPRLLQQAGLEITATLAHAYAEIGTGTFFAGFAEVYAPFYAEWDLAQSRPISFTPPPSAFALMPLPPALAYRWGGSGTLVPETRLASTTAPVAPPLAPVGNPLGGASFTI